ncbi:hypothetical protein C8R31_101528 [Nitrosospira sp. Nsp2]|nr:hypothetical protein C8R31_101528 [Nitrosospira sp. Nsp2]
MGLLMPNVTETICLIFGMSAMGRTHLPCLTTRQVALECRMHASPPGVQTILISREFVEAAKLKPDLANLENVQIVYLEDLRVQFGLWDTLWLMGFACWMPAWAVSRGRPDDPAHSARRCHMVAIGPSTRQRHG